LYGYGYGAWLIYILLNYPDTRGALKKLKYTDTTTVSTRQSSPNLPTSLPYKIQSMGSCGHTTEPHGVLMGYSRDGVGIATP